jgi:hypothetical protein
MKRYVKALQFLCLVGGVLLGCVAWLGGERGRAGLGDNAGMAGDDSWAQVRWAALRLLDGARPSRTSGSGGCPLSPPSSPRPLSGPGTGRWTPAAGPGRVGRRCWLRAGGVGLQNTGKPARHLPANPLMSPRRVVRLRCALNEPTRVFHSGHAVHIDPRQQFDGATRLDGDFGWGSKGQRGRRSPAQRQGTSRTGGRLHDRA